MASVDCSGPMADRQRSFREQLSEAIAAIDDPAIRSSHELQSDWSAELQLRNHHLLLQLHAHHRNENNIARRNIQVLVSVISTAFAILTAFQLQLLFYEQMMLHTGFNAGDVWDVLYVRLIWWTSVTLLTPLALRLTKHASMAGYFRRSFGQNGLNLSRLTIPMFGAWAFKDLVIAVVGIPDGCGCIVTCYSWLEDTKCTSDDLGQRLRRVGSSLIICFATWTFSILIHRGMAAVVQVDASCEWAGGCVKENMGLRIGVGFSLGLGLGYALNDTINPFLQEICLYYLNGEDFSSYEALKYQYIAMLSLKVVFVALGTAKIFRSPCYKKACTEPSSFWNCAWIDLLKAMWYAAYRPMLGYSLTLTTCTILVCSSLKNDQNLLKGIEPHFSSNLIPEDQHHIEQKAATFELHDRAMAIVVGWGWTGVVANECTTNFVAAISCPTTGSKAAEWTVVALVVHVVYEICTFAAYHLFIESQHLQLRLQKVAAMSRGETVRVLAEFDNDSNMELTKEELINACQTLGLDQTVLVQCFDQVAELRNTEPRESSRTVLSAAVVPEDWLLQVSIGIDEYATALEGWMEGLRAREPDVAQLVVTPSRPRNWSKGQPTNNASNTKISRWFRGEPPSSAGDAETGDGFSQQPTNSVGDVGSRSIPRRPSQVELVIREPSSPESRNESRDHDHL